MFNTHFQKIYLKLGNGCNLKCEYCSQEKSGRFLQEKTKKCSLNNKVIEWLDNYKNKINKLDKPTYIVLWGGEPLLYFETIQENRFRAKNKSIEYFEYENCDFQLICAGGCAHVTKSGAKNWCEIRKIILTNLLFYLNKSYNT